MKLATWNVNSLKVRLGHLLDWLAANPVDFVGLQETKTTDDKFPVDALRAAGYEAIYSGQPTYNGVALLWRSALGLTPRNIVVGNPLFDDPQRRLIGADFDELRLLCAYFPNGQSVGSEKYDYKLRWMQALHDWLATHDPALDLMLFGDFNVAPDDRDVHDPAAWDGQVLVSAPERDALARIAALGLDDAFRLFEQPPKSFSWWDYRQLGFRRNAGLRIDHILVSQRLRPRVTACTIDKAPRRLEKPSDHAPVVVEWGAAPVPR
ncbi:MAG: exodeoxyribonuclease III [Lautropia sp.]